MKKAIAMLLAVSAQCLLCPLPAFSADRNLLPPVSLAEQLVADQYDYVPAGAGM